MAEAAIAVSGTGARAHDAVSSPAVAAAAAAVAAAKAKRGRAVSGAVGTVWAGPGGQAAEVARRLHLTGPLLGLVNPGDAVAEAAHLLRLGLAERVVIGATDDDGAVCAVLDTYPEPGDAVVGAVRRTVLDGAADDALDAFAAKCLGPDQNSAAVLVGGLEAVLRPPARPTLLICLGEAGTAVAVELSTRTHPDSTPSPSNHSPSNGVST
ncbi:hypothetical protein ACOBQX_01400 [Actinokineospora sp. G85]|uniref:hypothetical protein n=1 Tax=Actinokineospora sp. G85 TaxID=3406626 RepID=UPI003C74707A